MTVEVYNTILGFIFGVVGTSFGAVLSYHFAIRRDNKESLRKIVIQYRSAFAVNPANILMEENILKATFNETYDSYRAAVVLAWLNVPESFRPNLTKAWDEYRGKDHTPQKGLEWIDTTDVFDIESFWENDNKEPGEYMIRLKKLYSCLDDLL